MIRTEVLDVTGMKSEECTEDVLRAIKTVDGVATASVSYPQNRAIVQFDEERTAPQEMQAALKKAGYGVRKLDLGSCGGGCCGGVCSGKQ